MTSLPAPPGPLSSASVLPSAVASCLVGGGHVAWWLHFAGGAASGGSLAAHEGSTHSVLCPPHQGLRHVGFQVVFADCLHEMVSWGCSWPLPTRPLSGATACAQTSLLRFHPPHSKRPPGALPEESLGPWSPWGGFPLLWGGPWSMESWGPDPGGRLGSVQAGEVPLWVSLSFGVAAWPGWWAGELALSWFLAQPVCSLLGAAPCPSTLRGLASPSCLLCGSRWWGLGVPSTVQKV